MTDKEKIKETLELLNCIYDKPIIDDAENNCILAFGRTYWFDTDNTLMEVR